MRQALVRSAAFVAAYFLILLAAAVPKGMVPRRFADLTWGTVSSLAVYGVTRWLLQRERRTPRDVGVALSRQSFARLLLGGILGVLTYGVTVGIISMTVTPIHFDATGAPAASTLLLIITGFLALSCMEELGFRAYPLRTLLPVLGHWPAQIVVAAVFALSHGLAGWPWETVWLGVFPSALLFGALATRTGGLAMPIGFHAALNIAYWMVGAKESPGVWRIRVDPAAADSVTTIAPLIGAAVMVVATLLVSRPRRPTDGASVG